MRDSEAEAFLIRIEEGRELFLVSFACLPFFLPRFSGIALDVRISRFSLLESVCCVAKTFSDPDFQYALREEILCPTQGDDESDYLMCMQALFARLNPPWNLTEQLNYAL